MRERGENANAGHARCLVERLAAPEWGRHSSPLTGGPMTSRAAGREHQRAASGVAGHRFQFWNSLTVNARAGGNSLREKGEVRDDVAHLAAVGLERLTVHAALKAVVDPIFEEIDAATTGPVLREARV